MPLDQTNWNQETETKPDVFSLEGLIAWLETQPPEMTYRYVDVQGGCLIGLYASGMGFPLHNPDRRSPLDFGGLHSYFSRLGILGSLAVPFPQTLGAALSRARALLAETRK